MVVTYQKDEAPRSSIIPSRSFLDLFSGQDRRAEDDDDGRFKDFKPEKDKPGDIIGSRKSVSGYSFSLVLACVVVSSGPGVVETGLFVV